MNYLIELAVALSAVYICQYIFGDSKIYFLNTIVAIIGAFIASGIYHWLKIPLHTEWGKVACAFIGSIFLMIPVMYFHHKRNLV